MSGVTQQPYKAVARALEVIPRTLIQNCGGDMIRTLTALRAKHAAGGDAAKTLGIDGESGKIVDMNELGVWEPLSVKLQAYKTAIEVCDFFISDFFISDFFICDFFISDLFISDLFISDFLISAFN